MKLLRLTTLLGICAISGFATVACGDAADAVTNTITCGDVCDRYAECFDRNYDVDACVDRCENDATADEEKEAELEECEACIDDESCTSSLFECAAECGQFVP